jgi:hypothetical protein
MTNLMLNLALMPVVTELSNLYKIKHDDPRLHVDMHTLELIQTR